MEKINVYYYLSKHTKILGKKIFKPKILVVVTSLMHKNKNRKI